MSTIQDYKEFKKHQPNYKPWKEERDIKIAKKVQYLKNNPISNDEFEKEINRAKIVLNAVDIMDEYSQSRAEEMEQVSQAVMGALGGPIGYISLGLSVIVGMFTKGAAKALDEVMEGNFKNTAKLIPAIITYLLPVTIFSSILNSWAAKKEIEASRKGRQEATEKDLASINQFALLDKSQQQEVERISQTIEVDKKDAKKIIANHKSFGVIEAIKTIFKNDEKKFKANIELNNAQLSQKDILEAKKDMDLIQNVVEKIDIASQDYAENAEYAVEFVSVIATAGCGVAGLLAGLITKHIKGLEKYAGLVGSIVSGAIALTTIILGAKIDKQASRVGRFKAKQEFLNNPEQLIYVDESQYANISVKSPETKKKNYFKEVIRMLKDNKEYNEYIKKKNVKNIQLSKAREQIQITKEQVQRAKQLQNNVFNMFNKLDEKSQSFSESTEALGNTLVGTVGMLIMLPGTMIGMFSIANAKSLSKRIASYSLAFGSCLVPLILNLLVTKEQKNASRVANMEAIKELNDYRYFAQKNDTKDISKATNKSKKSPFDKFLNKKSI